MKAEFYINFKAKKKYNSFSLSGAPKTSIKKPVVSPDEVCVKMIIDIPDAFFDKPILAITGKIDSNLTKESYFVVAEEAKKLIEERLNITCDIH